MITEGVLAATVRAGCIEWASQKVAGASLQERVENLSKSLRQCWPFVREWHYLCAECSDYGLRIQACAGDATCGRSQPHLPHEFGTACWCHAGGRYKVKERTPDEAVMTAAKARRTPSRFGR